MIVLLNSDHDRLIYHQLSIGAVRFLSHLRNVCGYCVVLKYSSESCPAQIVVRVLHDSKSGTLCLSLFVKLFIGSPMSSSPYVLQDFPFGLGGLFDSIRGSSR